MGFYTKIREKLRNIYRLNKIKNKYQVAITPNNNLINPSVKFTDFDDPLTSIIIPFNRQIHFLSNCIKSIYNNLPKSSFEIIVINDNNINNLEYLKKRGIKILNTDHTLGFAKSINLAIPQAKGKYIHLLSANTHVQNGFLDELIYVFNNFANVGTAGSMLLHANGDLKEAGAFYLNDGQKHKISKESIYNPEVNYIYQVDYSSCHSLLFEKVNNSGKLIQLDESLNAEEYSAVDLCFNLKYFEKKKNYFTPFSKITKLNISTTHNSSTKDKSEKSINDDHTYFQKKWKEKLHTINSKTIWERIQELYDNNGIIFFHYKTPEPDNNSGDLRLSEIIKTYASIGYHCAIVTPYNRINNSYNEQLQRLGVRVYYEYKIICNHHYFLKKLLKNRNYIWFSTSDVFLDFYTLVQKKCLNSTLIFDMVDVHHLRYKKALEISPNNLDYQKSYKRFLQYETEAAQKADVVITISEDENNYMKGLTDISKLLVISNIHYTKVKLDSTPSFSKRKDLLFIGSSHHPNIDAINFLIDEIMPLVWNKIPEIQLNIIGDVNKHFTKKTYKRVNFLGYVPDIKSHFLENRIMVAPLRYGAGVKGKIGQAFEYYLPVVTSSIGAEGMFLTHEQNALLADNAEQFANEIIRLYNNEKLWREIQQNIENSLKPFSIETLIESIHKIESFKK